MRRYRLGPAIVLLVLVTAAALALLLVALAASHQLAGRDATRRFDPEAWREADLGIGCRRYLMISSLGEQYLFVGTALEEIRDLLGSPDYEKQDDEGLRLEYYVGMYSGFGIDPDYLTLWFRDGALARWQVVQH